MRVDRERLLDFSQGDQAPEGVSAWLPGFGPSTDLSIADPDPSWGRDYDVLAGRITEALGAVALEVDHVGSTSVAGLPAKPIIDVVIVVADPDDEAAYAPGLSDAGFVHVVREPWWHGHRLFRNHDPRANIHVFGPDCPEVARMRIFRDWLRTHSDDLETYRRAKIDAAAGGGHVMDYNARKEHVLRNILRRAVMSAG